MAGWIDEVRWGPDGLIAAVAQNPQGKVLMVAWMNRAALEATVAEGKAVYWSRSRGRLWRKGEVSGHEQRVLAIRLDCDGDAILLTVEQKGGIACHTGRASCFFRKLAEDRWVADEAVLKDPAAIYGKPGGS
ncbi:MAG: phosphoribosyl-AMP cyclohydrolase [Acidiferrobacteraceae bacterium]